MTLLSFLLALAWVYGMGCRFLSRAAAVGAAHPHERPPPLAAPWSRKDAAGPCRLDADLADALAPDVERSARCRRPERGRRPEACGAGAPAGSPRAGPALRLRHRQVVELGELADRQVAAESELPEDVAATREFGRSANISSSAAACSGGAITSGSPGSTRSRSRGRSSRPSRTTPTRLVLELRQPAHAAHRYAAARTDGVDHQIAPGRRGQVDVDPLGVLADAGSSTSSRRAAGASVHPWTISDTSTTKATSK